MRRIVWMTVILAAAAFAAWADTATLTLSDAPEEVVVQVYPKRPVTLDQQGHGRRMGNCQVCHHKPDSEKCSDCHEAKAGGDARAALRWAFNIPGSAFQSTCKGEKGIKGISNSAGTEPIISPCSSLLTSLPMAR